MISYVFESNSNACNIYKQIKMLELGSLQLGQWSIWILD
jgi:hypothetical protein